MSHRRNNCHINININIVLLEPAQAGKEYSVSVGSVLTQKLVNSRLGFKAKVKGYPVLGIALWMIPCRHDPAPAVLQAHPQGGHISNSCLWPVQAHLCPGRQLGSIVTAPPARLHLYSMILLPHSIGGLSKSQRRQEDFLCSWSQFINHLSMESIPCQANSASKNKK